MSADAKCRGAGLASEAVQGPPGAALRVPRFVDGASGFAFEGGADLTLPWGTGSTLRRGADDIMVTPDLDGDGAEDVLIIAADRNGVVGARQLLILVSSKSLTPLGYIDAKTGKNTVVFCKRADGAIEVVRLETSPSPGGPASRVSRYAPK